MLRRLPLLLAALLALVVAGCGNQSDAPVTEAETEGIFVEVAGLKYQVQVSRLLNPLDRADQGYLQGLAPEDRRLERDEEFFAVLLRVENEKGRPLPSAADFAILDTQENVYRPLEFLQELDRNPYAYQPAIVPPNDRLPLPDTAAGERPPYGNLLLFKVRRFSLDNRPLELVIESRQLPRIEGIVNLDV